MEWIKVEKGTIYKPEIAILARKLDVSIGEAFAAWFQVYAWLDEVCSDGSVPHLSLSDGDTLSRVCPGTLAALASPEIGWVTATPEGLRINNWEKHNGTSAKQRSYEQKKKARQRQCPGNVPESPGQTRDKNRDQKKKRIYNPPPTPPADPPGADVPLPPTREGGVDLDRKNRNPKPPPPTDGGREETMRRIVEAFPALGGRMVSPAELARRTAGLNGSTAAWIAALLGACLDSAVVAPLSVVDRRLAAKKYSRQDEAAIRRMLSPPLPPRAHYSGRCPQCRYDTGADLSPGRGTIEAQCGNCGAAVPLREEGGVPG